LFVRFVAAALIAVQLIPWAWERREDLRFLGDSATVAYYAGIVTLRGREVDVGPRRNPLLLAPGARRIAVVRIETRRPSLDDAQRAKTVDAIERLTARGEEVQIDFDAARSERAFYRALLIDIRRRIPSKRLTITALASWCLSDRWIEGLPIDEAIPMLFRMSGDDALVRARLERGEDFRDPRCRASAGVSLDEPRVRIPSGRTLWIFNPKRWSAEEWKKVREWP